MSFFFNITNIVSIWVYTETVYTTHTHMSAPTHHTLFCLFKVFVTGVSSVNGTSAVARLIKYFKSCFVWLKGISRWKWRLSPYRWIHPCSNI